MKNFDYFSHYAISFPAPEKGASYFILGGKNHEKNYDKSTGIIAGSNDDV